MNKNTFVFSVCLLLVKVVFGQQGNTCNNPIDLNIIVPEKGNGKIDVTVNNSASSQFYTYTATQEGVIEMSSAYSSSPGSSGFDTWLKVYDDECNIIFDEDNTPGLLGGVEYTVEVSIGDTYIFEWSNQEWGGVFDVEFIFQEKITDGVTCDNPISITLGEGSNIANYWFGAQYYTYTAPEDGVFEISTCNDIYAHYRQITILDACEGNAVGEFDDSCDLEDDGYGLRKYDIAKGETVIVKMNGYSNHMHFDYNFSASFTEKEKIALPDVEFEKRLIGLGIDTKGVLDGFIFKEDAEAVTGILDLSYVDAGSGSSGSGGSASVLKNLTGIDAFINITGLKISKNSPFVNDAVEVIDLSKNLKLTSVEFNSTTAVNSFDFSKNTKLESLKIISDYTSINTLNLTGLINLRELRLQNITLQSLNLSAHPNLEILDIYISSNLSSLNFNSLTRLNNLRLERMGSSFTVLDLTVSSSSLRYLNIINNSNLRTLTLSDFSFLSSVTIKQNPLLTGSVDFSSAKSLLSLDISSNDLSFVNLKSGENDKLVNLDLRSNTNLSCVKVDKPSDSYGKNNWLKDVQTYYVKENCDRVRISDTEFEKRLISKGIDTTGQEDGYILLEDAEAVTDTLDMTENGRIHELLTSYSGIESFVNITGFIADSDNDVLTSLDLSSNTKLTSVDIKGVTNFSDFDFTANTSLNILKLGSSRSVITDLNISGLVDLEVIEVYNSSIESLNLESLTKLTTLNLNTLSNLKSIDISNTVVLEQLTINNCSSLTSLNIANGANNLIVSFDITNNAVLECVKVDDITTANTNWNNKDVQTYYSKNGCEFVSIPDAEFEKRLIALGIDSRGLEDGLIFKGDAESVTGELNLTAYVDGPIANLTGIENFSNITSFKIGNNSTTDTYTRLDLSNSLLLEEVILNHTSATSLDFSTNTNIKILKIEDSVKDLESLNIIGLINLEELRLGKSNFATLDLTTNTSLKKIYLNKISNLVELDLSKNINLLYLSLSDANSLSTLDLTNNQSLEQLTLFNDSSLLTLNLSNNTSLEQLNISSLNNLKSLNVANGKNNILSDIFINNNKSLVCVQVDNVAEANTNWTNKDYHTIYNENACDFVSIPDEEFEKRLINLGIANSSIVDGIILKSEAEAVTSLNISDEVEVNGSITDLTGIEAFVNITVFKAINVNDRITSLDLSKNTLLEELNIQNIMDFSDYDLSSNRSLKKIQIKNGYQPITSLNISNSAPLNSLEIKNVSLNSLNIATYTGITNFRVEDAPNLLELDISSNTNIKKLFVVNCDALTSLNTSNLSSLQIIDVKDSSNLLRLDLSSNNVLSRVSVNNNTSLRNLNATNIGIAISEFFNIRNNPSLLCVQVDNIDFANTIWTNKDAQTIYSETYCEPIEFQLKAYLQGAVTIENEAIIMKDDLRSKALLPALSPYEQDVVVFDFAAFNEGGAYGTGSPDDDIVDWVYIQLLDKNDETKVLSSQSALIQRKGSIVSVDGFSNLSFELPDDNYYISISHRNHITIRSKVPIPLSKDLSTLDFTNNLDIIAGGENAMIHLGDNNYAMPAGDIDNNDQIQVLDVNQVILNLGISGYNSSDIDMNGEVQNLDINNFIIINMGKGKQF